MSAIGLSDFNIPGKAFITTVGLDYAWLRSHAKNIDLGIGLNYTNSSTTFSGIPLFKDNIRSVNFYGTYSFLQSASTYNTVTLSYGQGLNVLGAADNPPSRLGEHLSYSLLELYASSAHRFSMEKISSLLAISAQYAFNTVPSAETFSYGGMPFGYGYDPSTISGDRGIDARAELQYKFYSYERLKLNSQLFIFADCGFTWNINKTVQPSHQKDHQLAAGLGQNLCNILT